jgi:hypothetical protein
MALPFQSATPSLANTPGVNQTNILNAVVPPEGPKSAPVVLDFTNTNSVTVDFTITTSQGKLSTVQMIYVDNSLNDAPVNFNVQGTSQNVTVPAGAQGWFPIVATNRPKFVCTTDGHLVITTLFLNVPVAQGYWFPAGNGDTGASQPLIASVTTGGTAVSPFNSIAPNRMPSGGAVIKNPTAASEALFVDIVNVAQTAEPGTNGTTVSLAAGQSFVVPPNFTGTVSVNAVSSAHVFVAYGVGIT